MSGLETLFGVWDIKVMPGRHREQEAKQLLEKLADQVGSHAANWFWVSINETNSNEDSGIGNGDGLSFAMSPSDRIQCANSSAIFTSTR